MVMENVLYFIFYITQNNGASTKRTVHDLLPSRVYMQINRSNTLAGHENTDKRSENLGRRSRIIMKSTGWTAPTEPFLIGICKLYFLSANAAFSYKNQCEPQRIERGPGTKVS